MVPTALLYDIKRVYSSGNLNTLRSEESICIELPILSYFDIESVSHASSFFKSFQNSFWKNLLKKEVFVLNYHSDSSTEYIYVAYITLRNGKRIYANQYGLKAFRIRVRKAV